MRKEVKKKFNHFLFTIDHKTCWDNLERRCKNCKLDNGQHPILGVDLNDRPHTLFCPLCFKSYGYYEEDLK